MTQIIKVSDTLYKKLEELKRGRRSFGDVIADLLTVRAAVLIMMELAEDPAQFREWQRSRMIARDK